MPDASLTFRARRGKQAFWGVAMILLGIGALPVFHKVIARFCEGIIPGAIVICIAASCPLFFGIGLIRLFGAAMRLPRLTIDAEGVQYKKPWGTRKVAWERLAPFKVTASPLGYFHKPVMSADSFILETDAGRRKKAFIVDDDFDEDIGSLAERLNAARLSALRKKGAKILEVPVARTGAGNTPIVRPWLTCWIFLLLSLIYLYEILFAPTVAGEPSIETLAALGAVGRELVFTMHQWYRIITAPLLHANWAHLVSNGIALFFAGMMLEGLVGRVWFGALFIIGAVGGSLMSLAMNDANMASVGASGAIMSLFAVLFILSFRSPRGHERRRVQYLSMRVFIPVLLPLGAPVAGVHVDGSAHLGGLIAGTIAGLILLKVWRRDLALPPYRRFAQTVVIVGAIAVFIGISTMMVSDQHVCADYSDKARAIKACTALIESKQTMQTNKLAAIAHLGELYGKSRQYDLALRDFDHVIALDPGNPTLLLGRGMMHAEARQPGAAIADFDQAENLTHDDSLLASINGERADVYFGLENLERFY